MPLTLQQIGEQTKTDKALGHRYCDFYDKVLAPQRNLPIRLLEIGIYKGSSIQMWRNYFPKAEVCGIDINITRPRPVRGAAFHRVNADILDQLRKFAGSKGEWDVVIDDGGHTMRQQQFALKAFWPKVKSGGIFIMEDLHTSFGNAEIYNKEGTATTFDLICALRDGTGFESLYMTRDEAASIASELKEVTLWWRQSNLTPQASGSVTSILFKK